MTKRRIIGGLVGGTLAAAVVGGGISRAEPWPVDPPYPIFDAYGDLRKPSGPHRPAYVHDGIDVRKLCNDEVRCKGRGGQISTLDKNWTISIIHPSCQDH